MSFNLELDQACEKADIASIEVFPYLIQNEASGLVRLQKDKILRQFQFLAGGIAACASNFKPETPGGYLQSDGALSEEQFAAYTQATTQEKKKPWSVIAELTQVDTSKILEWKKSLAKAICEGALKTDKVSLIFQPATEKKGSHALDRIETALVVASSLNGEAIEKAFPALSSESAILSQDVDPPEILSPEEKGLFTVAKNSANIAEVFEGSFLERDRILQLLLTYYLAGLLNFESAAAAAQRAHMDSLSKEDLELRQEVLDLHVKIKESTYYEFLNVDPKVEEEEITGKIQERVAWLTSDSVEKTFSQKEKAPVEETVGFLKEIERVLSSEEKRKEYDLFLEKGSMGSFVDQSLSLKEDEFLQKAGLFEKERKLKESLGALDQGMRALPRSSKLLETYIDFFHRFVKADDAKAGQRVLAEIQRGKAMPEASAGFFAASGRWFEKNSKIDDAKKFYTKALEMDPHQISARQAMENLDPKTIAPILLLSFQKHLKNLTFYDLLGIHRKASKAEVQKAYRDCTRRFHPDRFYQSSDEDLKMLAKDVYKRMVEAYMTLKNEGKREDYDAVVREGLGQVGDQDSGQLPPRSLKKEKGPQTPQGKKFYNMAIDALRTGSKSSAVMNLQLGLQVEPDCLLLQEKLAELQAK